VGARGSEAAEPSLTAPTAAPTDEQQPAAPRRSRWIGRRARSDDAESDLRRRLAGALTSSAELERLVSDLPLLRSFPALSLAVARMLEELLEADTVAVWRQDDDGWHAVAHRGLSVIEAQIVVAPRHPLFAEVDTSGGALLIDPVDSAQGVVAGIGGAHTESLMAASIAIGPGRYGIVTVGRNEPLRDRDLDRLVDTVLEAAIGLALADWFERIASLAGSDREADPGGPDDEPPDEPVDAGLDGPIVDMREDLPLRS